MLVLLDGFLLQGEDNVDVVSQVLLKVRELALVEPCFVVADFHLSNHIIDLLTTFKELDGVVFLLSDHLKAEFPCHNFLCGELPF